MNIVKGTIDDRSKKLMYSIEDFYCQRLGDLYKINSAVDYDLHEIFGSQKERKLSRVNVSSDSWFNSSAKDIVMSKLRSTIKNQVGSISALYDQYNYAAYG